MLLRRAKSHDILHAGAVVPTAVENNDLPRRGKVGHISLNIHLRFLPIGGRRQRHHAEYAGTDTFRDGANRPALPGAIASFKQDNDPKSLMLDPFLEPAEFSLKL